MEEHYLIIGAGPVGLSVAKALKEAGIPYVQAEADDDVGGNWYHGVYETANILSSRHSTEYPEFPMPEDYPDFPSALQMNAYYRLFAEHYKLRDHIQFNTKVVHVTPAKNNLWRVTFADGKAELFKGVLICNGHHWSKRFPQFDGLFTGETLHSKDYKSPGQLKGKRVLVVGAGNSAFDISSEAARVGSKSFISVRRGIWIFPKTFMGKPLSAIKSWPFIPRFISKRLGKLMLNLVVGKPEHYGLPKPAIDLYDRHPTINTDTLINIKNGRIKVKPAVARLDGNAVHFTDGSTENVDTIVYATGYHLQMPFLPKELHRVEESHVKVYAHGMYDDYKGIYIIGWFQPRGGVGPLISAYGSFLAQLLPVQDRVDIPLGRVFREMGEKLPESHLIGGEEFLNWVAKKKKQLTSIEKKTLKLNSKYPGHRNKLLQEEKAPELYEMTVY